jgi:hypothetical protein
VTTLPLSYTECFENWEPLHPVTLRACPGIALLYLGKSKRYSSPSTGHEGPEGELGYSSPLSFPLALDGGGWSTSRPGSLTPGKETRYPLYRRLDGPQGRSGRLPPPGFDPRTFQPVANRYTDYAIPARHYLLNKEYIFFSNGSTAPWGSRPPLFRGFTITL